MHDEFSTTSSIPCSVEVKLSFRLCRSFEPHEESFPVPVFVSGLSRKDSGLLREVLSVEIHVDGRFVPRSLLRCCPQDDLLRSLTTTAKGEERMEFTVICCPFDANLGKFNPIEFTLTDSGPFGSSVGALD